MAMHPSDKRLVHQVGKLVSFVKRVAAVGFVIFGISACGQEGRTMNQPAAVTKAPIVLKNNPVSAESVVLGMGCFWGVG